MTSSVRCNLSMSSDDSEMRGLLSKVEKQIKEASNVMRMKEDRPVLKKS
jgi:hypothetical protein